jgi:glycosyltransferase involved in cell wall biosynthesis
MDTKKKILIISPSAKSPFVRSDAEILAKEWATEILGVETLPFPRKIILLWRLFTKLVNDEVLMVLMYFSVPVYAPFVVLLTKLFGKKVAVITGGYDTTYVPVIDWGEMKVWWKRLAQRIALSLADLVLAFSEFSKNDVLKYARPKKIKALYFGIDTEYFKPKGKKEPLAITVCFQLNATTLIQKGLRTMIEAARSVPKASFVLIGQVSNDSTMNEARRTAPPNVIFQDKFTPAEELLEFYQRATAYLQVSAHEGFGIANAEAMACECIPIGTYATALPEVVGDAGFLVPFNDVPATVVAIKRALASPEFGKKARKRIIESFSFEMHERALLAEFRSLLSP